MYLCSAIPENVKLFPLSISNDICIYCVYLNIPFSLNKNDVKQFIEKNSIVGEKGTIKDKIRKETIESDLTDQKELPVLTL